MISDQCETRPEGEQEFNLKDQNGRCGKIDHLVMYAMLKILHSPTGLHARNRSRDHLVQRLESMNEYPKDNNNNK